MVEHQGADEIIEVVGVDRFDRAVLVALLERFLAYVVADESFLTFSGSRSVDGTWAHGEVFVGSEFAFE